VAHFMVGFAPHQQRNAWLNGRVVGEIHADLSSGAYLSSAQQVREISASVFIMGSAQVAFEFKYEDGRLMLALPLKILTRGPISYVPFEARVNSE